MRLTVFFDGQFWIGILEWESAGVTRARRHVFGCEPADAEILAFVRDWVPPSVAEQAPAGSPAAPPRPVSPKRSAREAARLLSRRGGSTKSQEALQRELEERKAGSRRETRGRREEKAMARRETARRKAKKKHRGH